jgi:Flp pilus assembly protein TadG
MVRERGNTLLEFVFVASIFFMLVVGIVAFAHLYFTHNLLVEATRRGARYALFQCGQNDTNCLKNRGLTKDQVLAKIKNVVMYDDPAGGTTLIHNLTAANIVIEHSEYNESTKKGINFGVGQGTVTVRIVNYDYNFVIPGINKIVRMPEYRTTLTGESAGFVPKDRF